MMIIYGDFRDLNCVGDYDSSGPAGISREEKEELRTIWDKFISGKLNLTKGRIRNDEYLELPKIFICHHVFEKNEYTTYSIVRAQRKAGSVYVEHCKSYANKFIDKEQGVLVLEKMSSNGKIPESLKEIKEREVAFHKEILKRVSSGRVLELEVSDDDRKDIAKSFEVSKQYHMDEIDRWLNKTTMRWFY